MGRKRARAGAQELPESARRSGRARKAPKRSPTSSPAHASAALSAATEPSRGVPETPVQQQPAKKVARRLRQTGRRASGAEAAQNGPPSEHGASAAGDARTARRTCRKMVASPANGVSSQPDSGAEATVPDSEEPSRAAVMMTMRSGRKLESPKLLTDKKVAEKAAEKPQQDFQQLPSSLTEDPPPSTGNKIQRAFSRRKSLLSNAPSATKEVITSVGCDAAGSANVGNPEPAAADASAPAPATDAKMPAPAHGRLSKRAQGEAAAAEQNAPTDTPSAPVPAADAETGSASAAPAQSPAPKASVRCSPRCAAAEEIAPTKNLSAPAALAQDPVPPPALRRSVHSAAEQGAPVEPPAAPAEAPASAPEPVRRSARTAGEITPAIIPEQAPAKPSRRAAKSAPAPPPSSAPEPTRRSARTAGESAPAPAPATAKPSRRAAESTPMPAAEPSPVPDSITGPARRGVRRGDQTPTELIAEGAETSQAAPSSARQPKQRQSAADAPSTSAAPSRAQGKPKHKGKKDKKEHASKKDKQPSAEVLGCSKCRKRPTGCQACSATALGCTKCRFKEGGCGLCKRKASLAQQAAEQQTSDSQPTEEDVQESVPLPLTELKQGHEHALATDANAAEWAQASNAVQVHPIWRIHALAPWHNMQLHIHIHRLGLEIILTAVQYVAVQDSGTQDEAGKMPQYAAQENEPDSSMQVGFRRAVHHASLGDALPLTF